MGGPASAPGGAPMTPTPKLPKSTFPPSSLRGSDSDGPSAVLSPTPPSSSATRTPGTSGRRLSLTERARDTEAAGHDSLTDSTIPPAYPLAALSLSLSVSLSLSLPPTFSVSSVCRTLPGSIDAVHGCLDQTMRHLEAAVRSILSSRPLYVMLEPDLQCNSATDHLAPKVCMWMGVWIWIYPYIIR
ncbi:hypothetical protein KIPB_011782 [Kipferlia bialata]|uniref:Uncharacterized protein n=1 Tax=Kipferlia bialata TaxID=797122 RepID=A0A9K3D588_9EUKA|nr:hypothetical protein KIPB_011782 [Kipferlia bialata]|eukprot:g11782.t1